MVVLQFHVPPEVLKEIRKECEATGKTISEVSRDWLMKGKLEADKMRATQIALTVLSIWFPIVIGIMSFQLIWA